MPLLHTNSRFGIFMAFHWILNKCIGQTDLFSIVVQIQVGHLVPATLIEILFPFPPLSVPENMSMAENYGMYGFICFQYLESDLIVIWVKRNLLQKPESSLHPLMNLKSPS